MKYLPKEFIESVNGIVAHYYNEIDKIFTINFTLLAFIITAITILLMLSSGKIVEFKEAGLLDDAMSYFYKSLGFNFISGVLALISWILNFSNIEIKYLVFIISATLMAISLYYTYQSYRFLIYFVEKQK